MTEYTCPKCKKTKPSIFFPYNRRNCCSVCLGRAMKKARDERKYDDRYIYALVDPRDSVIYYVGQTINLKHRLNDHIYRSRSSFSKCDEWIVGLKKCGLKPIMIILETVTFDTVDDKEISWIRKLAFLRAPLTNNIHLKSHKHVSDLIEK